MLIGITQKIRNKFKYIKLNESTDRPDEIFCWHASHFIYDRLTGLHIMNNKTRYSVVLFNIKKKEVESLKEVFKKQLKTNLLSDGVDELTTSRYLKDLGEVSFVKTNNRSINGQLNNGFYLLESDIYHIGTNNQDDFDHINSRSNSIPMLPLEKHGLYPYPNRAMKDVLNSIYNHHVNTD